MMRVCGVLVFSTIWTTVCATLNSKAWQSSDKYPDVSDFPEYELLKSKPNVGIAFTGGGSRAYVASIGILAGLTELDLTKNIRYISGISGGSWATTVYSYAQNISDDILLGRVVPPEKITETDLKIMNAKCARSFASVELLEYSLKAIQEKVVDGLADSWCYGVQKTYLEPSGIPTNTRFSWNADTVKQIMARNPSLASEQFLLPSNSKRPFPIIGTTLVGPTAGAPFTVDTQNFTMLEITPLYVGQFMNVDVSYKYNLGVKHTKRVGGAIEPFAFAKEGDSPTVGLTGSSGILKVPEPTKLFDLQNAACASSYAPGSLFESIKVKDLSDTLGLHFSYWSPTEKLPKSEDYLYSDGGTFENIQLISLLQRRVSKIALFYVSKTPLQPTENYDVRHDEYDGSQLESSLPYFFGVVSTNQSVIHQRIYEDEKNQVFATSDYPMVVEALQAAQAKGDGIIATFNLTTVENTWWGIPAGFQVEIMFSYLGRVQSWEKLLSPEMYPLVVPSENADDMSVTIDEGPFRKFPHYFTLGGAINHERANILADMTGWTVLNNAELFKSFFV